MVANTTPNRNYPLPDAANKVNEDVQRLIDAFAAIDGDVAALLAALATKAATTHGHAIADVTGLATALDGKAAVAHNHTLAGLSDVSIAGAPVGRPLTTQAGGTIGIGGEPAPKAHGHQIGDVTGLAAALAALLPLAGGVLTGSLAVKDTLDVRGADGGFRIYRISNEAGIRRWEFGTDTDGNFFLHRFDAAGNPLTRVFRGNYGTGSLEIGTIGTEIGQAHVIIGDGVLEARWLLKTGGYNLTFAKNDGTAFVDAFRMGADGELYKGAGTHKYLHEGNAPLRRPTYTSGLHPITAIGKITMAHGLGEAPKIIQTMLQCVTAEHGFAVGEVIYLSGPTADGGSAYQGASIRADATNIHVTFPNTANAYFVTRSDNGNPVGLTNANWNFRLRAFA
ncbi:hypothetical protein [Stappia sp.]|uniref:hypothetical protein n=1 Tax=Stappia sp. TaxID=1870903 RepID=UPI003A999570